MPRLRTLFTVLAIGVVTTRDDVASALVGSRQPPANGFPSPPWALAHRGASGVLPEHSAGAYQLAIDAVSFGLCVVAGMRAV